MITEIPENRPEPMKKIIRKSFQKNLNFFEKGVDKSIRL